MDCLISMNHVMIGGMSEHAEAGSDRVTISMPRGYKAALEARVRAGEAPSVSALVTRAVDAQLARERTDAWIMSRRSEPVAAAAKDYWRDLWAADADGQAEQVSA